jgi:hypothetical protein
MKHSQDCDMLLLFHLRALPAVEIPLPAATSAEGFPYTYVLPPPLFRPPLAPRPAPVGVCLIPVLITHWKGAESGHFVCPPTQKGPEIAHRALSRELHNYRTSNNLFAATKSPALNRYTYTPLASPVASNLAS